MIMVAPSVLYIIVTVTGSLKKEEVAIAATPSEKAMPVLRNDDDTVALAPVPMPAAALAVSNPPPSKTQVVAKSRRRIVAKPKKAVTPATSPSSPEQKDSLPTSGDRPTAPAPTLPEQLPAPVAVIDGSDTTTSRAARMQLLVELLEEKQLLTERKVALLQRMETLELFISPDSLTHMKR